MSLRFDLCSDDGASADVAPDEPSEAPTSTPVLSGVDVLSDLSACLVGSDPDSVSGDSTTYTPFVLASSS